MNTKKDRVLFCKEASKILIENSFVLIEQDKRWNDWMDKDIFELKTAKNGIKSTVYTQTDNKLTYSVFCVLDKPSLVIGNRYSGKVNFHSSAPVLEAIADFEDHIKLLIESEL